MTSTPHRAALSARTIKRISFILLLLVLWVGTCAIRAQGPRDLTEAEWRDDVTYLTQHLEATHPNPWARTPRDAFRARIDELVEELPQLHDRQIAVRLMQAVASLGDGHTNLEPTSDLGFDRWFPVRFYRFADGIFITAIDRRHQRYIASRVERIGNYGAAQALDLASALQGSDNRFGAIEDVFFLSNAEALHGLGITDSSDVLWLELVTPSGWRERLSLPSVQSVYDLDWRLRGEMFGPPVGDSIRLVTAFDGREATAFREHDQSLPRHLRYRGPYDFEYVEDVNTVYMQFNFIQDDPEESFAAFCERLFGFIDEHDVHRFVLDLRYNGGGDGGMTLPFVHEIIRRDTGIDQPGRFFTLVGRKTFGAAVMLMADLKRHTHTVFVGEPAGAPLNHFGDAAAFSLPNSGMRLTVSTRYWQLSTSDDTNRIEPVEVPARFTSGDYFQGRDPALDAVLTPGGFSPISRILVDEGGEAARQAYEERLARYGSYPWWQPWNQERLSQLAYALVRQGRLDDAVVAFELNAERFFADWRVWDGLGDGYLRAGRTQDAIRSFRRALAVDRNNPNAEYQRRMIATLGTN